MLRFLRKIRHYFKIKIRNTKVNYKDYFTMNHNLKKIFMQITYFSGYTILNIKMVGLFK